MNDNTKKLNPIPSNVEQDVKLTSSTVASGSGFGAGWNNDRMGVKFNRSNGKQQSDPKNANKPRYSQNKLKTRGQFKQAHKSEFEEKLVKWKRVSKTTKGGRRGRIWTLVIVGNRKGLVGYGIGKANEFPDAMKKATKNALKNVVRVKINPHGTLYHENITKVCASKLIVKPAKFGIGIIAGGPIKIVLELAGYSDVYSKNLGSSNTLNMVKATIKALVNQKTPDELNILKLKRNFHPRVNVNKV